MELQNLGAYTSLQRLHASERATVYLARHGASGDRVALKVLHARPGGGLRIAQAGQRAVAPLLGLRHPYIVQLRALEADHDPPFLVMEYVEAEPLADRLAAMHAQDGPIALRDTARLLTRVADALDYAHAQGVIHGALEPAHILCTALNEPLLIGFATAARIAGEQEPERPDQSREGGVEGDVAALGRVLCALLAGCPPGEAVDGHRAILAVLPYLPAAAQDVVRRVLSPARADRFDSAGELARAFSAAVREIALPQPDNAAAPQATVVLDGQAAIATPRGPAGTTLARPTPALSSMRRVGRYEVERELGRGGMAVVCLARDPFMRRPVAVKMLPPQATADPGFRTRFQREAELIAAIEHTCVVQIYDYGEQDDQTYIVMHYLPGGSLASRLAHGPLTLQEASPILDRVAAALDAAHEQHIIHRDIKPGNILFGAQDDAFLSDFGISVRRQSRETTSQPDSVPVQSDLGGTLKYMSPEQVTAVLERRGADVNARSDIYSLGITLFQALTGQIPYDKDTPYATAVARLAEPVPSIHAANPALPRTAQGVIDRVLARDPADRYETASDLARDVKELATGRWYMRLLMD